MCPTSTSVKVVQADVTSMVAELGVFRRTHAAVHACRRGLRSGAAAVLSSHAPARPRRVPQIGVRDRGGRASRSSIGRGSPQDRVSRSQRASPVRYDAVCTIATGTDRARAGDLERNWGR